LEWARHAYTDKSFEIIEQAPAKNISRWHCSTTKAMTPSRVQIDAIADLDKAYKSYIGPAAPYHDAYVTYNNRPVIFIFPKSGKTDWNRVRQHVSNWAAPPLLLYKDDSKSIRQCSRRLLRLGASRKRLGARWQRLGQTASGRLLQAMKEKYPQKILVPGGVARFDDTRAKWGLNAT